jgi:hypothetical protein
LNGGLKRMDFKETNPYSRSRARFPRLSVITSSPTAACESMFLEPGCRITLSGRLVLDEEISVRFTYKLAAF